MLKSTHKRNNQHRQTHFCAVLPRNKFFKYPNLQAVDQLATLVAAIQLPTHWCKNSYLIIAQTSPARFLLHAVALRYSMGFSRYVSIMKLR